MKKKTVLAEQTSHDLDSEIKQLEQEIQERKNKLHSLKLQRGGFYLRREAGLDTEASYP